MIPKTQYTKSGNISIAYQVFGTGSIDLVYIPGWVSNIDWMWECPELVAFFKELGKIVRIILFDKRGTGLSDRIVEFATLEERMEDINAVMNATNSKKAILFGHSEGGSVSALFSATYPKKVLALITFGIFAKRRYSEDYPWAPTDTERQKVYDMIENSWGSGDMNLQSLVPSKANDEKFMSWLASYFRSGASPRAAMKLTKMNTQVDIIDILKYIKVPTLLMQRTNDIDVKIEEGKFIAERIKGAKFIEFDGNDHLFWAGNTDEVLCEMKRFISQFPIHKENKEALSAIAFGQIMSSSNTIQSLMIAEFIEERGGEIVNQADRFFTAIFETPGKAINVCNSLLSKLHTDSILFSAGIYMSDTKGVSNRDDYMITAILSSIRPNNVVVTQTIKNLLTGSTFEFIKNTSVLDYESHDLCELYSIDNHNFLNQKKEQLYGVYEYDTFLEDTFKIIEENIDNNSFNVEILTKTLGVSERKLQRKLKEISGKSPNQLITFIRLSKAKNALLSKKYSVSETAFKYGFSSPSYFAKCFKKEFGISPTEIFN